jgi:hypothetical protein
MVSQGSLTSSLSQLLQGHFNSLQLFDACGLANFSPTVTVHGDDSSYVGTTVSGQNSVLTLENAHTNDVGLSNGIISDSVSCASNMWPEEFVSGLSKQS